MSNSSFDCYTTQTIEDGKLVIKNYEVTSTTFELLNPVGDAIITHIGANASIRFMYEGVEYRSCSEGVAVAYSLEPKYITTKGLTFNHDISKMFTVLFIFGNPNGLHWVEVPENYNYVPEGWLAIPKNNEGVKVGDVVLTNSGRERIVTKIGGLLFHQGGTISSWEGRAYKSL